MEPVFVIFSKVRDSEEYKEVNGLFIEVFREKMEELEYVKEVPEEGM